MNKYKEEQNMAHKIIDGLGSNDKIAQDLGISAAAVSYWRRNGIPTLRMIQLKSVYGNDKINSLILGKD